MVTLIWAMDKNWLVGKGDRLPWHYPEDLKFFKQQTKDKIVLMGGVTFDSMKGYYKNTPLPFSKVYVADINNKEYKDAITVTDVIDFLNNNKEDLFVIGGPTIYKLSLPFADRLIVTHIDAEHEGDVYMNKFDFNKFEIVESEQSGIFNFTKYKRREYE